MVKLIMGLKGTGKTKQMIDLVNDAVGKESGSVICIERGKKLTYDINYKVRLVDSSHYSVDSYMMLKGFICGLYAGNFDISHIFIDSIYKVANNTSLDEVAPFLEWLEAFSKENEVKFTITVSDDITCATEELKRFFVNAS